MTKNKSKKMKKPTEWICTQGKKGMKMPRINMAFTPSNIDFIRVMSSMRGQTMTRYVNDLIEQERAINGHIYQCAKGLCEIIQMDNGGKHA